MMDTPALFEIKDEKQLPGRMRAMILAFGKTEGQICRDCDHLICYPYHGHHYFKCELNRETHGAGTDWRCHWPACGKFVNKKETNNHAAESKEPQS